MGPGGIRPIFTTLNTSLDLWHKGPVYSTAPAMTCTRVHGHPLPLVYVHPIFPNKLSYPRARWAMPCSIEPSV